MRAGEPEAHVRGVAQTPQPHAFSNAQPFIHAGPLTRTTQDAILVCGAMAGVEGRDPYSAPLATPLDALVDRGVAGLRIGYTTDLGGFPVEAEVTDLVTAALADLERAGAIVVPVGVEFPVDHAGVTDLWLRQMGDCTWACWRACAIAGSTCSTGAPISCHPRSAPCSPTALVARPRSCGPTTACAPACSKASTRRCPVSTSSRAPFWASPRCATPQAPRRSVRRASRGSGSTPRSADASPIR
ncbi:MAG: hypothetical protein H0V93_14685 [Euzebyales bacterium]|nr:hypothetical protein [Euzebyales bacterium]